MAANCSTNSNFTHLIQHVKKERKQLIENANLGIDTQNSPSSPSRNIKGRKEELAEAAKILQYEENLIKAKRQNDFINLRLFVKSPSKTRMNSEEMIMSQTKKVDTPSKFVKMDPY